MAAPAVAPRSGPDSRPHDAREGERVALPAAIAALQRRLGDVEAALDGTGDPPLVPGFDPVPAAPPSKRERALLVQFAWVAYTVLAGRPPAAAPPAQWPWQLARVVPLAQRRRDVPPALGRVLERLLTAPAMAPLPSVAGIAELLRRAAPRPVTPPHGVQVAVDLRPSAPEPAAAVVARLSMLAAVLAGAALANTMERRRALFRLAWTGWERLTGAAPWPTDLPYVLHLGATPALSRPSDIEAPHALWALLERLLDQTPHAQTPAIDAVRAQLQALATLLGADTPPMPTAAPAPSRALAEGAAAEASRLLDGLAAAGLVRSGATAASARSLDERLAVTGLAWGVYQAATGEAPLAHTADGTATYRPVATVAPTLHAALAEVVDATLAPAVGREVPGVAAWLAAAEEAAAAPEGSPTADAGARAVGADAPSASSASVDALPVYARPRTARRPLELLPEDAPSRDAARRPALPWVAGVAAAAAVWWLSWSRASGGP